MREDTESADWFGKVIKDGVTGWVNMKYLYESEQDDRSMATKVAMFAAKGAKAAVVGVANVVYSGVMALDRIGREKSIKAVGRVVWDAFSYGLINESPTFKLRDTVSVSGNIYMNSKDELPNSETDSLNFVNNKLGVIVSITDNLYNLKFNEDTFGVGILPFQLTKPGNSPTLKQLELQERLRVLQQQQEQQQDRQLELQLEQLEQRLLQEKQKQQKQQKLQKLQQELDKLQQPMSAQMQQVQQQEQQEQKERIFYRGYRFIDTRTGKKGTVNSLRDTLEDSIIRRENPSHYIYMVVYDDASGNASGNASGESILSQQYMKRI
jgi:hypothetical protein